MAQAAGKDWSAALANMQAATLREDCRPESVSFSEAREEGILEQPNRDRNGKGSHSRGMSHQKNSVKDTRIRDLEARLQSLERKLESQFTAARKEPAR